MFLECENLNLILWWVLYHKERNKKKEATKGKKSKCKHVHESVYSALDGYAQGMWKKAG